MRVFRKTTVIFVVCFFWAVYARCAGPDFSCTNWPDSPDWVELKDHVTQCYTGLVLRCLAVGSQPPEAPSFVYPYYDYLVFAKKIDEITQFFINPVYTNAKGSFADFFATPLQEGDVGYVDGKTNFPVGFPMWSVSNLHVAAGFTNWATNVLLHSWGCVDHSIQMQVTECLNLMTMTKASTSDVQWCDAYGFEKHYTGENYTNGSYWDTNVAHPPQNNIQWQNFNSDPRLTEWPALHFSEGSKQNLGNRSPEVSGRWESALVHELSIAYKWESDEDRREQNSGKVIQASMREESLKMWSLENTAVEAFICASNLFSHVASSCQFYYKEQAYTNRHAGSYLGIYRAHNEPWCGQSVWFGRDGCIPHPEDELKTDAPCNFGRNHFLYLGASDCTMSNIHKSDLLRMEDFKPGNLEAFDRFRIHDFDHKDSYCFSHTLVEEFHQTGERTAYDEDGVPTTHFYEKADCTRMGYEKEFRGWDGASLTRRNILDKNQLWIWHHSASTPMVAIDWSFPKVTKVASALLSDIDTDRDDITQVNVNMMTLGPDTGTMLWLPRQDEPEVIIPFALTPAWYAGPPVHVYFSQGGSTNLPYNYLLPSLSFQDIDGYYQSFSVYTRILESAAGEECGVPVKRVSMIRPRGQLVVFDFPWDADKGQFSSTGYPIGINEHRTYILRDITPSFHRDKNYDLCFESGIIHHFGVGRYSIVRNYVNSVYKGDYDLFEELQRIPFGGLLAGGCLCAVSDCQGYETVICVPASREDQSFSNKMYWQLPGCESAIFYDSKTPYPPVIKSDGRYCFEVEFMYGRPASFSFTTLSSGASIIVEIQYDEQGQIVGLFKSGIEGAEKSNVSRLGHDTIQYSWGTVQKSGRISQGIGGTVELGQTISGIGSLNRAYKFSADDKLVSESLQIGHQIVETKYSYNNQIGRYGSGLPKKARLNSIQYPSGATVYYDYYQDNGRLKQTTMAVGNGSTKIVDYAYERYGGGIPADELNMFERPRSVEVQRDGILLGRTLYSFDRSRTVIQHCLNPLAGWGDPDNLCFERVFEESIPMRYSADERMGQTLAVHDPSGTYSNNIFLNKSFLSVVSDFSDGRVVSSRINNRGIREYLSISENGIQTLKHSFILDDFGRVIKTEFLDGSCMSYGGYLLAEPSVATSVDGSEIQFFYNALGLLEKEINGSSGITSEYQYNVLGNVEHLRKSANDGTLSEVFVQYDALGRAVFLKDVYGGDTVINYQQTSFGSRAAITTPFGGQIIEERYFDGRLKERQGSGTTSHVKMEYSAYNGCYAEKRIFVGNGGVETEWEQKIYDLAGRVIEIRRPASDGGIASSTFAYDAAGRMNDIIDEIGIQGRVQYNEKNEVTDVGIKLSGEIDFASASRDRFMSYERTVDPTGIFCFAYCYPEQNNPSRQLYSMLEQSLDGKKNVGFCCGVSNTMQRSDYQAGGRYSVEIQVSDRTKMLKEYHNWRPTEIFQYDCLGIPVEHCKKSWDGLGHLKKSERFLDGSYHAVSYARDEKNRLLQILPSDARLGPTTFTYKPGTCLKVTENGPCGNYAWEYYPNGLVKREFGIGAYDVSFIYDAQGRCTAFTTLRDGKAVITEMRYNRYTGQLQEKKLLGKNVPFSRYTYRPDGRIAFIEDANGVVEALNYDSENGDYIGCTFSDETPGVNIVYDRMGRASGVSIEGGISLNYTRALDSRILSSEVNGREVVSNLVFEYIYSAKHRGRKNMECQIDGLPRIAQGIEYDNYSKIKQIQQDQLSANYTRHSNATLISSVALSLGSCSLLVRSNSWDVHNMRLKEIAYYAPDGREFAKYHYDYRTNSFQIAETTELSGHYWQYDYDSKGQVLSGKLFAPGGSEVIGADYRYSYDEIGNIIEVGVLVDKEFLSHVFEANDLNLHVQRNWGDKMLVIGSAVTDACVTVNYQPAQRKGAAFSALATINNHEQAVETNFTVCAVKYDGTNDVVAKAVFKDYVPAQEESPVHRETGEIEQDSRFDYFWNARGQLVGVKSRNTKPLFKLEFDYYPNGQRARKRVFNKNGSDWVSVRTCEYYYDGWLLLAECVKESDSEALFFKYMWGLDLAGQRTARQENDVAGIGGLLAVEETTGSHTNVYCVISDGFGSVRGLVDQDGKLVAQYEYSPFGAPVGCVGAREDLCKLRFQSRYYDTETGFYYFGYRYYDPTSCKWLSPDPLEERGGLNLTAFCRNDPANTIDPLGLEAYIVYREFADPKLIKKFPDQGHVFLAFDEEGILDVQKWRGLVLEDLGPYKAVNLRSAFALLSGKEEDPPNPDLETFSFHPWEVYDEEEGSAYNIAGIAFSVSSYIGYNDDIDQRAFESIRDNLNNPKARKALLFPLCLTEDQQFELYEKAIVSRNINNSLPEATDLGWYKIGALNCGSWTLWITEQVESIKYPDEMRKFNRLPLLPRISAGGRTIFPGASVGGVGIGGVADFTLLPQTATLVLGAGGLIYHGAGYAGCGLYKAGACVFDIGEAMVNNAELMPDGGGLIRWRF